MLQQISESCPATHLPEEGRYRARADLAHIDATLKLFDPEPMPASIKPKLPSTPRSGFLANGEISCCLLEAVRRAGGDPVSARGHRSPDHGREGLDPEDAKIRYIINKRLFPGCCTGCTSHAPSQILAADPSALAGNQNRINQSLTFKQVALTLQEHSPRSAPVCSIQFKRDLPLRSEVMRWQPITYLLPIALLIDAAAMYLGYWIWTIPFGNHLRPLHFVATLLGVLIHVWGDLFVFYAALIVWRGRSAFGPDMFRDLPARPGMAISVFPVPLLLSVSGGAIICWGILST